MFASAPRLPCTVLLAVLLWVTSAALNPLQCHPKDLPGLVIEISVAVAKGARFTDPINSASAQECVSACCAQVSPTGDRACNLAVYDTRKRTAHQNCYLFLCPSPESCPMSPARGVLSYSLWTENSRAGDPTEEHVSKSPKLKDDGKSPSSSGKKPSSDAHPVAALASEDKVSQGGGNKPPANADWQSKIGEKHSGKGIADTPGRVTSELLRLAEDLDKKLEKLENKAEEQDGAKDPAVLPADAGATGSRHKEPKKPLPEKLEEDAKDSGASKVLEKKPETLEVHFPTPKPTEATTTMSTTTATTKMSTTTATTKMSTSTATTTTKATTKTTSVLTTKATTKATTKTTTVPTTKASTTLRTSHRATTTTPNTIILSPTRAPNLDVKNLKGSSSDGGAKSATDVKNKATEVPTTRQTNPPQKETSKEALQDVAHPYTREGLKELDSPVAPSANLAKKLDAQEAFLDKSGLVAALVFGLLFLAVVIGLVSRKVTEARRRHHYTKLDYLINGMYVDT